MRWAIEHSSPAMQAYPTMTIPAEIAHKFTCRRGSEGIVTVISRTLRKTGDRRSSGPVRAVVQARSADRAQALGATTEEVTAEQTLQAIAA